MTPGESSYEINRLYYITHISNIPSILAKGVFSHSEVDSQGLSPTTIYNQSVNNVRRDKRVVGDKFLWHYANLFVQPRNPMLFTLMRNTHFQDDIAILEISPGVLEIPNVVIADGLAARSETRFYTALDIGLERLRKLRKVFDAKYWKDYDPSGRQIMAEVLVPNRIPPTLIQSIYVPTQAVHSKVKALLGQNITRVIKEPNMFFLPSWQGRIIKGLSLADSDMFFSKMQTITISVNTVGVMGKGLASRAKYQFPDVFLKYVEVCRSKQLTMGKPYLYKREVSNSKGYFDDFITTKEEWPQQWFLLFPTKNDWRLDSDFEGIEQGLIWLVNNYKKLGIRSIALPALGCGLGNLSWDLVGPLMCKYLQHLDITSVIYLPREHSLDRDKLTPQFLLKR